MMQQFATFLSLITIGMCFVLKLPQIFNIISVKSASQISVLGLLLELFSYTVMTSYNYTNGYALLSYMEYPIILIQEFVLIFFVLKYLNKINTWSIIATVVYFVICTSLFLEIIPKSILMFLTPMCTPISASSKVIQLLTIVRAKSAKTVSATTWFISAFTNFTRVFTVWVDSADILLLGNFIISLFLSSSIMFVTLYYNSRVKAE